MLLWHDGQDVGFDEQVIGRQVLVFWQLDHLQDIEDLDALLQQLVNCSPKFPEDEEVWLHRDARVSLVVGEEVLYILFGASLQAPGLQVVAEDGSGEVHGKNF